MVNQTRKLEYMEGDIPCMLLPMVESTLLLPTVAVAEMAPMKPVSSVAGKPEWFFGYYEWREVKVPLVSYERLNGAKQHELLKNGRVAVVNSTGVNAKKLPYLAIATHSIPRMARIGENDIEVDERSELGAYDTMRVMVGVESLAIPNIQKIENEIMAVI